MKIQKPQNKFSERLKELRIKNNLTQKRLAKEIGCKPQNISQWERKVCEPNLLNTVNYALYFKVSTDYIIGRVQGAKSL